MNRNQAAGEIVISPSIAISWNALVVTFAKTLHKLYTTNTIFQLSEVSGIPASHIEIAKVKSLFDRSFIHLYIDHLHSNLIYFAYSQNSIRCWLKIF